ncbi:hypothetical protein MASR2M15_20960 [Anaerolineales bacterium]
MNRRYFKIFLTISIFTIVTVASYYLLAVSERKSDSDEKIIYPSYDIDSIEWQVISTVEKRIVPRKISDFSMDDRVIAMRYPMAENALLGRYDADFANKEVIDILCDLKNAGIANASYEIILTFRDEDENKQEIMKDAIGIRLEKKTMESLNCFVNTALSITDIADDYRFIYLEDQQ